MAAIKEKIVEAYLGEYASGKSEVAVNRAMYLLKQGREVTIVDLDLVEPFYTLRPIKKKLEEAGLGVVAWETDQTFGFGETGVVMKADMRWALRRSGDVIFDIGYGVSGARTMNLVEGAEEDPHLKVYAVVNISRPITGDIGDIVDYVKGLGRVDGLINNSHLGDDTDIEVVQRGAQVVTEAARALKLPVLATTVVADLAAQIGPVDCAGNPVWPLTRFMEKTFW